MPSCTAMMRGTTGICSQYGGCVLKQMSSSDGVTDEDVMHICEKAIALMPSLGVTDDTLKEACVTLGREDSLYKFPNGIRDVLDYMRSKLVSHIANAYQNKDKSEIPRVRDKILALLEACIEFHAALPDPQRVIGSVVHYCMLPSNTCFAMSMVFRISDAMWRLTNDMSTDFNYYTKRFTLSTMYAMSILHMTRDTSDGFADTRAFAKRRIDNIIAFSKFKNKIKTLLPKGLRIMNVRFDR